MPYNLHGLALGYLVSGASLGAADGAILGGPASDRFGPDHGRRNTRPVLSVTVCSCAADRWFDSRPASPNAAKRGTAASDHGRGASAWPRSAGLRGRHGGLAAGARPGRRPRSHRAGAAHPDARVAPLAAPARPLRRRAQGTWPRSARATSARATYGAPRRSSKQVGRAGTGSSAARPGPRACGGPAGGRVNAANEHQFSAAGLASSPAAAACGQPRRRSLMTAERRRYLAPARTASWQLSRSEGGYTGIDRVAATQPGDCPGRHAGLVAQGRLLQRAVAIGAGTAYPADPRAIADGAKTTGLPTSCLEAFPVSRTRPGPA